MTVDQVVVEVETAKAAVEVPVPFAGTVIALHGEPGETLRVGAPLISVGVLTPATTAAPPLDRPSADGPPADGPSGNVLIGYGTSADRPTRRRRAASPKAAAAPRAGSGPRAGGAGRHAGHLPGGPRPRPRARAGPVGGAPLGRGRRHPPRGCRRGARRSHGPRPCRRNRPRGRSDVRIPLNGIRKAVADKLTTSRREIPEATTWVDVDATELLAARTAMNATLPDADRVSLLALLARLAVAGAAAVPPAQLLRRRRSPADRPARSGAPRDRGADAAGPRRAGGRGRRQPDHGRTRTAAGRDHRARAGRARCRPPGSPGARSRSTTTASSASTAPRRSSTTPRPRSSGSGGSSTGPGWSDGAIVVRKVAQVSLAFDHRVCDGGEAGGFLRLFADYVEDPVRALAHL